MSKSSWPSKLLSSLLLAWLAANAARAEELRYVAVDLGTVVPGYRYAAAYDLNNRGQVAGYIQDLNSLDTGFITGAQGSGVRLTGVAVTGINDDGASTGLTCNVAGYCRGFVMGARGHNAVYLRPPGAQYGGTARGLGAQGQAAGWAVFADGHARAFRTDAGGANLHDLGTLTGTDSEADAINELGRVCGSYWDWSDDVEHVFITDEPETLRDVGVAGQCNGINVWGQLVGRSDVAFVTGADGRNARQIPLNEGTRLSGLIAINRHGQAVGWELGDGEDFPWAVVSDQRTEHLYRLDTLVDLPPGVTLQIGAAINDHGEIAADGSDGHLYLLKPIR